MNSLQKTSLNPTSNSSIIKTRFTHRFLRALKQLNNSRSSSTRGQRYHRVKLAANASMAAAVGSNRAWSRAILWKIRNRSTMRHVHANLLKRSSRTKISCVDNISGNPNTKQNCCGRAKQLRKIVPGGEHMEIGSLLEETAHYIKCLTTQVQVMKNIVDFCSLPPN